MTTLMVGPVHYVPMELNLPSELDLAYDQFCEFCRLNRDLRIERTAEGRLIVLPPTDGPTGARNASITGQLGLWSKETQLGVGFASCTGFALPNGAIRSPDASWLSRSRWRRLTEEERRGFPPLCPEFVIELMSATDDLATVQAKMGEYMANGATLGWLVDPHKQRVHVYRPDEPQELLEHPTTISGDPVLPDFVLDLPEIWDPGI